MDDFQKDGMRRLDEALRAAFPTRAALTAFLRFRMGVRLDDIAANGNLRETVLELLQWAEAQGCLTGLVEQAILEVPGNALLQAVARELSVSAAAGRRYRWRAGVFSFYTDAQGMRVGADVGQPVIAPGDQVSGFLNSSNALFGKLKLNADGSLVVGILDVTDLLEEIP